MGKIKGWKLSGEEGFRDGVRWTTYHSIINRVLWVGKDVVIDGEREIKHFETRDEALNYSREYMRSHPNG